MTNETEPTRTRQWNSERVSRIVASSHQQQLAVTESTTDLIAAIDIDGFLISLNSAGYRLLKLDIGATLQDVRLVSYYSKDSASAFLSDGIPTAIANGTHHSEVSIVLESGNIIPSSQVLIAYSDEVGNIEYFSVILRDISLIREAERQRKALVEQLHQSKKIETAGRIAGAIAHDFNNYMTVIIGHAELALLNPNPNKQTKDQLKIMLESATKASLLSSQLLDFSRKQLIKPETLDLNEMLRHSRTLITSLMGEGINITIRDEELLWPIYIDQSQLEQAIINLALNSREAMNSRGTFSLTTENVVLTTELAHGIGIQDAGEYVKLSIRDDGCGIDAENIANIFDPYFTTKDKGKGTGLGLSAVYNAMLQNRSHIRVISGPTQGCCFELHFPRDTSTHQPLPAVAEDSASPEPTSGMETILLIEDDEAVRTLLAKVLSNQGYTVIEASDGQHGLEMYIERQRDIALVVSDVVMPKMNGMELFQELRQLDAGIRILLISGHTEQLLSLKELSKGNVRLLNKPFPIQKFSESVREVLTQPAQVAV